MIARAEHKEHAKKTMEGKLTGMIGANVLKTLFNGATTAAVGVAVGAAATAVIGLVVAIVGAVAGLALWQALLNGLSGAIFDGGDFDSLGGLFGSMFGVIAGAAALIKIVGPFKDLANIATRSLVGPGEFGNLRYYMYIARNASSPRMTTVMDGFNDFLGILWTYARKQLFIWLWMLPGVAASVILGIIPAVGPFLSILGNLWVIFISIYKNMEYWATEWIKADHPEVSAQECMDTSKALCHSHVVDLFVMRLSFLGWEILSKISFGLVGIFYYESYRIMTEAYIYQELKGAPIDLTPVDTQDVAHREGISTDDVQRFIDVAMDKFKGERGQQSNVPGAVSSKAKLMGVSGMYANVPFEFNAGEMMIIGRDASMCNVVISAGAEQVSRKHCGVRFNIVTNEYEVIDYSSNGTLVNGAKITRGVPVSLPHGSIVSLGNGQNSFKLV